MDIERIEENDEPGYPTLDKHQINRRGMLKTVIGGLAAAGLVGCKKTCPPEIMGEMPMATPPEPPEAVPPKKAGEMVAPKPPDRPPVAGKMKPPEPPKKPERPDVEGGMPAPKEPERPALGGVMIAPQQQAPKK